MDEQVDAVQNTVESLWSAEQIASIQTIAIYLLLAFLFSFYIRFLYRRFHVVESGTDSVSIIFPLLTVVTVAVIMTIKSSLALSLGMVGALSIVRFRTAIRQPQELAYLFLCIAIGLSLGAEFPQLAVILVIIASVCAFWMGRQAESDSINPLVLTVAGDNAEVLFDAATGVIASLSEYVGEVQLKRLEVQGESSQVRVELSGIDTAKALEVMQHLTTLFPNSRIKIQ